MLIDLICAANPTTLSESVLLNYNFSLEKLQAMRQVDSFPNLCNSVPHLCNRLPHPHPLPIMLAWVLADLIDLSLHQRRGDMEGLKLQKQLLETQDPEKMIDLKETPLKKHGGYTQEEHIAIFESQIAGLGV